MVPETIFTFRPATSSSSGLGLDFVEIAVASKNAIATNKKKNKRRIDMINLLRSKFHETWGLITLGYENTSKAIKNLEDWKKIL